MSDELVNNEAERIKGKGKKSSCGFEIEPKRPSRNESVADKMRNLMDSRWHRANDYKKIGIKVEEQGRLL